MCADAFKALLRTLVGLEDFARSNAHYSRRKSHPCLHNSGWDRACLYCCYHYGEFHLDSEWHSLLACPLLHAPRREFILLTKLDTLFDNDCSVENLALLVARVREDKMLVNALARFALQVRDSRLKWFRQLLTEAKRQSLAVKLIAGAEKTLFHI